MVSDIMIIHTCIYTSSRLLYALSRRKCLPNDVHRSVYALYRMWSPINDHTYRMGKTGCDKKVFCDRFMRLWIHNKYFKCLYASFTTQ